MRRTIRDNLDIIIVTLIILGLIGGFMLLAKKDQWSTRCNHDLGIGAWHLYSGYIRMTEAEYVQYCVELNDHE